MVLYFREGVVDLARSGKWQTWHVGEKMPKIEGRVVTFQADGDELEFLKQAWTKKEDR